MLRTEWRWNAEREPVPLLQGSDLRLSLTLGMDLSCAFNKKDVWHSATMLKTQPPVEGSPLYSPAYLSTRHSHASVSETFAFAPDIFTHVSISWIQYPVWNCERDWGFFFWCAPFCLLIYSWLCRVLGAAHQRSSRRGVRASRSGGVSCCGAQPRGRRLQAFCTSASLLHSPGNPPGPGISLVSPASAGGFLPTVPPGKSDVGPV